jgi:phospholipid-binding lipoprotein MlaA
VTRVAPFVALLIAQLLAALLLAAPARADAPAPYDPYETMNRALFGLNQQLYAVVDTGVAALPVLPPELRDQVHSVFRNLRDPVGAAAGLVTGNAEIAWNAAARFAINSTLGVLGTREVATGMGYPPGPVDLGTALCRARLLTDPPFLVVPLIGPTNIGDLGGQFATNFVLRAVLGPYYLPYYVPYYVLDRIDRYMQRPLPPPAASPPPDPYVAQRSFYMLLRARRCALPAPPG